MNENTRPPHPTPPPHTHRVRMRVRQARWVIALVLEQETVMSAPGPSL